MSKSKNDSNFSGLLSESSTIRKVRGKLVITNKPKQRIGKPGSDPTKMEAVRARFLEASQYAHQQISIPESKALYATKISIKMRSAYMVAMSDYLSVPKVHLIDSLKYQGAIGDAITVKATDDFQVTKVTVVITNAAGVVIETGDAAPDTQKINLWVYKATVANPALPGTTIKAIAYDRPGNEGVMQIVL